MIMVGNVKENHRKALLWIMRIGIALTILIAFKEPIYLSASLVIFVNHEILRKEKGG